MRRKILTTSIILFASVSICGCSNKHQFDVDSKKGTTYITIPAELGPSEDLPKILADAGFTETDIESDGSVTYSISDADYDTFINETKESINSYIDELNESNEYETISNIKLNKDFDTITATINAQKFEESNEELTITALALKVLHYQAYAGETTSVKIKYIDAETDNVYDVVTIPQ